MKIKCEYCDSMFDDTLEKCPSCGAPNKNVRRSTPDQPTTIEELKDWYERMGLPPEDVTRFFIGKNHKGPRAFGIYKDEVTGNFIVYKNKDDGSRAVRYEGTDEAYAVNELHTRLKQEILQQKSRNISSRNAGAGSSGRRRRRRVPSFISTAFVVVPMLIFAIVMFRTRPSDTGYYMYNDDPKYAGTLFYHYGSDEDGWALFNTETGEWKKAEYSEYPGEKIGYKVTSKKYFLSSDYDPGYNAIDFTTSQVYDDFQHGFNVTQGYYSYGDSVYYHMKPEQDTGWYVYNNDYDDWDYIFGSDIPAELKHQSVAQDFWYTPDWNSETQITDFTETDDYQEYQDYLAEKAKEESSSSSSSDNDYSWSSSDSWDSGSTDWGSDW